MESDYWNVPPPRPFGGIQTSNTFSASVSCDGGGALAPRLRRYVHEIGEAVARVLENHEASVSPDADYQSNDPLLIRAERHLTAQGLRRQLAEKQYAIARLEEENAVLSEKAKESDKLRSLQVDLAAALQERDQWKSTAEQLKHDVEHNLKEHTQKYDELHSLFQALTDQSNKTVLLCDQRRLEIERLEAERLPLTTKIDMLQSDRDAAAQQFKSVHTEDRKKIEELVEEITTLRNSLVLQKTKSRHDLEELHRRHEEALAKKAQANELLTKNVNVLQKSVAQLTETLRDNEAFEREKESLRLQLRELQGAKEQCSLLEKRLQETESAYLAAKAKADHLSEHKTSAAEVKIRNYSRQLEKWRDAAVAGNEVLAADPQPSTLKAYLLSVEGKRSRAAQDIRRLTEENMRLNAELSTATDELHRVQLEVNELRLRTRAAEYETAVLTGELRSQHSVGFTAAVEGRNMSDQGDLEPQYCTPGSSSSSPVGTSSLSEKRAPLQELTDVDPSLPKRYRQQLLDILEHASQEKSAFVRMLSEYKAQMQDLLEKKEALSRKAESACTNFASLDLMLDQVKAESAERGTVIRQQQKTIESLRSAESSYGYEETEILRRERNEALKLAQMTREFYRNEAVMFRAIIKALLGWHIQIDMASVGKDITVTLRPALASVYQDDAALIFRVKSKLPSLHMEDLPKDVIEEEVYALFRDEDFDMHLDGRFADKWDTDVDWKNQLSARCSYAAFLAVTILAEQNQMLHCSAFLTAQNIRKTRDDSGSDNTSVVNIAD